MADRALVLGLGVSGEAVARRLHDRGASVVVAEDRPSDASRARAARLAAVDVADSPSDEEYERLLAAADLVVPSPGVPARHPAIAGARRRRVPVLSEVELASRWARVPLVAVTGTNGKTTVTTLVTDMLVASGVAAVSAGNIGTPLADAVFGDAAVLVVEVSSFQLQFTDSFRPAVAVWLNFAEDHLDWHPDVEDYAAAKARIWANQEGDDLALVNADDAVVMTHAASAPARVERFGLGEDAARGWTVAAGALRTPEGEELIAVADLGQVFPHDLANALAAAGAARGAGATRDGIVTALRGFSRLPHRVSLVGEAGGVRWYDDSKATNPHAALAALRGFDSVVLVAGGRNKGLDLSVLASEAERVRAVVAIGDAAPEVVAAFSGKRPVRVAGSMDEAVRAAAAEARSGDAVLLAPGCASFDWYRSYGERGDDFARAVGELLGEGARGHAG